MKQAVETNLSFSQMGDKVLVSEPQMVAYEDSLSLGISKGHHPIYNEDAIGTLVLESRLVIILADGHWGYEASGFAVTEALRLFRQTQNLAGVHEVFGWFYILYERINQSLFQKALQIDHLHTPETTLITAHIQDLKDGRKRMHYASLGDSFLYLLPKNNTLRQLNTPQSNWLGALSALSSQALDKVIGINYQNLGTTLYKNVASSLEVGYLDLDPGDIILLATDGLLECHERNKLSLEPEQICEVLSAPDCIEVRCRTLIQTALDCGGNDNIACAIYECPSQS